MSIKYELILYTREGDPISRKIYDKIEDAQFFGRIHGMYEIEDVEPKLSEEDFKQICDLFGGQTATSRVLGLKTPRHLRRVVAGEVNLPPKWTEVLKQEASKLSIKLKEYSES